MGRALRVIASKLKILKARLNISNKEIFGSINQSIKDAEKEVFMLEDIFDSDSSEIH